MENLIIKKTKCTPSIMFDSHRCMLEIRGVSYPENTSEFYTPVFTWLDTFLSQLKDEKVTVFIEIAYFNSSSSKILLDFFDILDEAAGHGKNIRVYWLYDIENSNAKKYGMEFKEDLQHLDFIISHKEIKGE